MKTTGFVDEYGVYHKGKAAFLIHDVNSQHKDWDHTMQRKEHSKDIIQPRKYGRPNREFLEAFPEESKKYFNDTQIKQAERNLSDV